MQELWKELRVYRKLSQAPHGRRGRVMDIIERLKVNVNNLEAAFPQTDTAQLESEAAETIESLRAEVARLKEEQEKLRYLLAIIYCPGPGLYHDDGELQDATTRPHIDFRRDHPNEIEQKMLERGKRKIADQQLAAATKDAERYRWLREQPNDTSAPRIDVVRWAVGDESSNEGEGLRMEVLDEAIDTARTNAKIDELQGGE